MKAKVLRYKKESNDFQEFVWIQEYGGKPMVFTSDLPYLHPETATIEGMKAMFEQDDRYESLDIDLDKMEFVEFEVVEKNTVGADIRNKLSPCLNLVELLEEYFSKNEEEYKITLQEFIKKEMKQSKKSIEYIASLL